MSTPRGLLSPWKRPALNARSDALVLWCIDRLRTPIGWFGVDFALLRLIVENRMRLGDPNAVTRRGRPTSVGSGTLVGAAVCAGMSAIPAMLALGTQEPRFWMLAGQALWAFLLAAMTISHFANVLIDPSDIGVLISRPIDGRTILAARMVQVLVEVFVLTVSTAILPTLAGCAVFDPLAALVAYPLATVCTSFLVLGAVTLLFAVALRVAGPQRFQRVTFWLQIAMATLIVVAPQIAPRVLNGTGVVAWFEAHPALAIAVPPAHGFGLFQVLARRASSLDWILAASAIGWPLILGVLTFLFTSRHFAAAIADRGAVVSTRARGFAQSWLARLGPCICSTAEARAAYGFVLAMSRRERAFLRGVLPQAALVVAMAVMVALPRRGGPANFDLAPIGLYYLLLVCGTACELSRTSEHAQASWWIDALPFERRALLLEGAAKALVVGIVGVALAALAPVALAVLGWRFAGEIALAIVAVSGASCWLAWWFVTEVPFTQPHAVSVSGARFLRIIVVGVFMGALVGAHVALSLHWISLTAGIVAFAFVALFGWKRLRRPREVPELGRAPRTLPRA